MDSKCTVYRTADLIGKRWSLPILLELYKGRSKFKRYSELKSKLLNITPKVLSLRLKELEAKDLISKRVDTSIFPIKSEYSLTESGKEFMVIIRDMKKWALKWKIKYKECEAQNCKECLK